MAKQVEGILGGFSGKLGTVVGSEWNGVQTMRRAPKFKANRKSTENQLVQRAKFALATKFFKRFTRLLKITFEYTKGQSRRGEAFGIALANAITGSYPSFSIDYSKVLVAKGKLDPAFDAVAVSTEPGKLQFNWTDNTQVAGANANDNAILVAYCEELGYLVFNLLGATRATGTSQLDASFFAGKNVQTWIAFRSPDGMFKSDSVYTGMVLVS